MTPPPRQPPTARGLARRQLGIDGEAAVAAWYEARGYELLARNWRCKEGEIDLVLSSGQALIFCEVKARSSNRFGSPFEAVTVAKQRRLRMLSMMWLAANRQSSWPNVRFDVAAVMGSEITVIQNAF